MLPKNVRSNEYARLSCNRIFVAAIVVGFSWSCSDNLLAQMQPCAPIAEGRHLGNGPVDINSLSQDILNCDVCRQRLGLPPLSPLNLASLPDSSSLPGSKVLSANVLDPNKPSLASQPSEKILVEDRKLPATREETLTPEASSILETQTLKKQLESLTQVNEQLQSKIKELLDSQAQKQLELEQAAAAKDKSMAEERQNLKRQVAVLGEKQRQLQIETKDRMARSDAENKKALSMLGKRTAEVTELQSKLRTQQNELAKAKAESDAKAKEENSKPSDPRKKNSKKKESGKEKD
ncbi:MAG: hypothetical protein NTU79_07035 [Planctomycetota bacterium]|nr:hypothetical protein [Planctomycetota bacterium]